MEKNEKEELPENALKSNNLRTSQRPNDAKQQISGGH
jgi:hypothetical protein